MKVSVLLRLFISSYEVCNTAYALEQKSISKNTTMGLNLPRKSLSVPAYSVYISQLIRNARTCSEYQDFIERKRKTSHYKTVDSDIKMN